jgi:hypothetical protein
VAVPFESFSSYDLVMIIYADWRILLAVGWIIKFPKLSIMEQKSVEEASGTYKEADDISFIIDLDGKGILRAGEIKCCEHAVFDHETVDW